MTKQAREEQVKEHDRAALAIAQQLHGFDMLDVETVLQKARALVHCSTRFDATGADFRHQVEGFSRHYGETAEAPRRQ